MPNPDHALSPGVYCTVFLIVSSEAIVFNRDGLSVAVVENGIARIRAVNVVHDFGTTVEVSGGAAGSSKQLFESNFVISCKL